MTLALAFEEVDVTDSIVVLTHAIYSTIGINDKNKGYASIKALIIAEGGSFRYKIDGNNPTADSGNLVESGDQIELQGYSLIKNFKAIRTGTTSGKIAVNYSG